MKLVRLVLVVGLFAVFNCSLCSAESEHDPYEYLLGLSLEELVNVPIQSSGLFAMEWDKAPGTYYVSDSEHLAKYGFRSIREYLDRTIPGIHTATHGNQGTTVGVRGILIDTTAKTLLLRDGLSLNTRNLTGINGSKLSTPLMGDLERIEVSLGPGAVQHGSGAINGYINMISATGKTREGLWSNASYGSGDSRLFESSYGYVVNDKLNVFLYGGYAKANGVALHYPLPTSEWTGLNGVNGTPSQVFLDNATIGKTDDDYKFSFDAQFGERQDFFNADLKVYWAYTTNVDPALGEYLGENVSWPEEVELAAKARRGRYSPFYLEYAEDFLIAPEFNFNLNKNNGLKIMPFWLNQNGGNKFSDELLDWVDQFALNLTDKTGCFFYCGEDYRNNGDEMHTGLSFIHNYSGLENQKIGWGAEAKYEEFHYYDFNWTTYSVFGEDQISWRDFSFLLGARYDKTLFAESMTSLPPFNDGPYAAPADVDSFTKRMAVAYSIDERQSVKLSYQEGFRFADKWPQHWAKHQALVNGDLNSDLIPEESTSIEANYTVVRLVDGKLNITSSIYRNEYENTHGWINEQYNFGNSPKNITSLGGEINLELMPSDTVEMMLSYGYSRPDDSYEANIKLANEDGTWTRYPEHMFKFKCGWEVFENFFVGGAGVVESPRYNKIDVTDQKIIDLFDTWDLIIDAVVSYRFNNHFRVALTAKELITSNYNQSTAYFQGTRPLDSPRAEDPQYYLTLTYTY